MEIRELVANHPVEDRSRNVKYAGWCVMLTIENEVIFMRKYHSTKCEGTYSGYDGKAFNKKDAIKQTRKEFALRIKGLLK